MNFLLLAIQSAVCVLAVWSVKRAGFITCAWRVLNFCKLLLTPVRDWDIKDAKQWWPVSCLLVAVIYTGSKSLVSYSPHAMLTAAIPVNLHLHVRRMPSGAFIPPRHSLTSSIFKNLTIILIAYGEVFMFSGHVTGLTLVSFALMVGSSVIAAWSDISTAWSAVLDQTTGREITNVPHVGGVSIGYVWMALNCACSAAYVLFMRKRIKVTGFKDWDSMFYNNLLSIPVLVVSSLIFEDWGIASLQRNFPPENRTILLSAIVFSGAAAVFISYSTAWCVRVCGSTTYS